MKPVIFLAVVLWSCNPLLAQDHNGKNPEPERHEESRNFLGVFVGNTIITQSKFQLPTIGIEYVREITPLLGVGIITELEIGSHIIQKNEDGDIISEVKREGAVLLLPSVFINVFKGLIVTAGYGVELERNENLALSKIGLEYALEMHNPKWRVMPSISWDHTKLFDGLVYGFTFGYSF
jgi:hypothetical protein